MPPRPRRLPPRRRAAVWDTRHATTPLEAEWALATTAYNRIAAELTAVDGEGQTIRIVLDDGLPHETSD
ncbi:hypothetical protein [Streptomyces globisporus]|uniref:hypothetical protein n=1 Tax=Streptomyces globisporus TaxID=1908 RepID=UPI001F0BA40F|nr:hypothetical protein [Streptomyces globisporus]